METDLPSADLTSGLLPRRDNLIACERRTINTESLLHRLTSSGPARNVIEPFTGGVLCSMPTSTEADVDVAFARVRAA